MGGRGGVGARPELPAEPVEGRGVPTEEGDIEDGLGPRQVVLLQVVVEPAARRPERMSEIVGDCRRLSETPAALGFTSTTTAFYYYLLLL